MMGFWFKFCGDNSVDTWTVHILGFRLHQRQPQHRRYTVHAQKKHVLPHAPVFFFLFTFSVLCPIFAHPVTFPPSSNLQAHFWLPGANCGVHQASTVCNSKPLTLYLLSTRCWAHFDRLFVSQQNPQHNVAVLRDFASKHGQLWPP
jgi:hypothetical protein